MRQRQKTKLSNGQWSLFICLHIAALLLLSHGPGVQAGQSAHFPVPNVLRPNVAFWKQVFTVWDTRTGILHDMTDVTIIYHTLPNLPKNSKQRQRLVNHHRRRYKNILLRLAQGKRSRLTRDEQRVLALFKGRQSARELRTAAHDIRFQLGLRERFAKGLTRSGAYMPIIREVFAAAGLPQELGLLPHVESSFNNRAYSKSRAAGMWQFTRGTGRLFLRIDRAIDERLDFRLATAAAAKLLQENYQALGTWPLAITAYNHGVGGMKRAVARLKTRDFGTIVKRYRSRSFGFASKNFYAEFLAAVEVAQNHHRYFPGLTFNTLQASHPLKLDAHMRLRTLAKHLGVQPQEIAQWNPAIRPAVLRGHRSLPKGYTLYIPHHRLSPEEVQARWARIPAAVKSAPPARDGKYRVQPGDTLSIIARRFRTSVDVMMDLNDIDRPHVIRSGRLLRLPQQSQRRVASIKRAPQAKPKPAAVVASSTPNSITNLPPVMLPMDDPHLVFHLLMAGVPVDELRVLDAAEWLQVKDGTIQVVAIETLGLYADWLEVPVQRLRKLNHMSRRRPLRLGSGMRLDFSHISEAEFTNRCLRYHLRIEENFFRAYTVGSVTTHTLKRGETFWKLARREYDVPLWLLHKYNYDLDFRTLPPGTKLRIPQVVERAKAS